MTRILGNLWNCIFDAGITALANILATLRSAANQY